MPTLTANSKTKTTGKASKTVSPKKKTATKVKPDTRIQSHLTLKKHEGKSKNTDILSVSASTEAYVPAEPITSTLSRPDTIIPEPLPQHSETQTAVNDRAETVRDPSARQTVPEESTASDTPIVEPETMASEPIAETVESTVPEGIETSGAAVFSASETTSVTTDRPAHTEPTAASPVASGNITAQSQGTALAGAALPTPASSAAGAAVPLPSPLTVHGDSGEIVQQFTQASASQLAASFPTLGTITTAQLNAEQKATAATTIAASAQMRGPDNPTREAPPPVVNPAPATLSNGITEAEPPPVSLPDVPTHDSEITTSAGTPPVIDTRGSANPNRAAVQRNESQAIVNEQRRQVVTQLQAHPGQQHIQPLRLEETVKPGIPESTGITIETSPQQDMAHFAAMPLPATVRQRADERMAPLLAPALSRSQQEISNAVAQRDTARESAIAENQAAVEQLNTQAQAEQQQIVHEARSTVAQQQQESIQQVQQQTDALNTTMNAEEASVSRDVHHRIQTSENEASGVLRDAETDAEAVRQEGEANAEREREKAERDGFWSSVTGFIGRAAERISNAIGTLFEHIRNAVMTIINAAKERALSLIESGRQWVVGRLERFGRWATQMVNEYLNAFPELQRRLNHAIEATVSGATSAINSIAENLTSRVEAMAENLANTVNSVLNTFQTALQATVGVMGALLTGDFAEAARIAFYAICDIAGIDPSPVLNFMNRAGETISIIFNDPGAFFNNVANGVGQGIRQFMTNIRQHLLNGLVGWLMGTLSEAGITLPERFDLRGIFSLVMQILGLTYANIRAKIVRALGPRGETVINAIEETVDFIRDFIQRGPIALWEQVQDMLSNLGETVMSGIRDWVVTRVIQGGINWLLSLLNPASAIIRAIKMVYDVVMFFVNRYQQIATFVQSVFDSVGKLAIGNLSGAANAVENAMGRSVPVIISFLASLIGLGGVGQAIRNTVERIRRPVDNAIDRVIEWVVARGRNLLQRGRAAVERLVEWWETRKGFTNEAGEEHTVYFSGSGRSAQLMIASTPMTYMEYLNSIKQEHQLEAGAIEPAENKAREIDEETQKTVPENEKEAQQVRINNLVDELATITARLPLGDSDANTPPLYGSLRQGFGSFARVVHMEAPLLNEGSSPNVNSDLYDKLNVRKMGGGTFYVRGHLLNENLGGPGNTWSNLTPLTKQANSDHKTTFENPAKMTVHDKTSGYASEKVGHVKHFMVRAHYGRALPGILATIENHNTDDPIPGLPENTSISDLTALLEAEQYVPTHLDCEAELYDKNNNKRSLNVTVNNDISYGELSQYSLNPEPKQRFVLADHIDFDKAKEKKRNGRSGGVICFE